MVSKGMATQYRHSRILLSNIQSPINKKNKRNKMKTSFFDHNASLAVDVGYLGIVRQEDVKVDIQMMAICIIFNSVQENVQTRRGENAVRIWKRKKIYNKLGEGKKQQKKDL